MNNLALETDHQSKEYKEKVAVRDMTHQVPEGEVFGFLGPKGAGKSTTVKVLSGILVPDSGRCRVLGRVPWQERTANARDIGVACDRRVILTDGRISNDSGRSQIESEEPPRTV